LFFSNPKALSSLVKQAAIIPEIKVVTFEWLVKALSAKREVNAATFRLNAGATATSDPCVLKGSKMSKSKKRKRGDASDDEDKDEDVAPKKLSTAPPSTQAASKISAIAKKPPVKVPVDHNSGLDQSHEVYRSDDGTIYDVTLNQTNAGQNNNKFYIMQLLGSLASQDYRTWTRWGRVGDRGQRALLRYGSLDEALRYFEVKFKDKTGQKWEDRHATAKKNKYTYIERNYEEDDEDDSRRSSQPPSPEKLVGKAAAPKVESRLPGAVQSLLRLIFDQELFDSTMASMNYDARKMPLGKLSKRTLTQGYQILKDISAVIIDTSIAQTAYGQSVAQTLEDLSNRYFSTIPHAFGRNRPPVIQDLQLMKKEVDLIESLTDMQLANEIMKMAQSEEEKKKDVSLLDRQYEGLGMQEMTPRELPYLCPG
jgi:poly [ADP-ribose] polymerase 2/3/4